MDLVVHCGWPAVENRSRKLAVGFGVGSIVGVIFLLYIFSAGQMQKT